MLRFLTSSTVALALAGALAAGPVAAPPEAAAAHAAELMRGAMDVVRAARDAAHAPPADESRRAAIAGLDPARAALIGTELTPLMTTMGSLESKRLATDARWASEIVRQFASRHLREGDTVLASFSGSFPGLNLAVMAACRVLGLRLVAISSVTASTWGANQPGFTWPEIEAMVVAAGVMPAASAAVTLGGSRDAARDLSEEGRDIARRIQRATAEALGATALATTTLEEAIARRLEIYRSEMGSEMGSGVFSARPGELGPPPTRKIHPTPFLPAAYVNVGGNHASLGGARATFRREEGWLSPATTPGRLAAPPSVTEAWLAEGVPVLNLLDVKALIRAWGLRLEACTDVPHPRTGECPRN